MAVLPLPPELDQQALPDSQVKIKFQKGHGKGGQHQNKTETAVRMTHNETGLHVFINGRDRQTNLREARKILTARVHQHKNSRKIQSYNTHRKSQMHSGRGDKTRTYNLMNNLVADHVLGKKSKQIKQILKGRFDLLIE